MRGREIRTMLRSQAVTILPRKTPVMRMIGVVLTPLTVHYVAMNPAIPTTHHIMLQLLLPQIHHLLKAFKSLLETYLSLQLPK